MTACGFNLGADIIRFWIGGIDTYSAIQEFVCPEHDHEGLNAQFVFRRRRAEQKRRRRANTDAEQKV